MDLAVRRVMAGGDAKEEDRRVDVGRAALWCAVFCVHSCALVKWEWNPCHRAKGISSHRCLLLVNLSGQRCKIFFFLDICRPNTIDNPLVA